MSLLDSLAKTTEDRSTVPETLREIGKGVFLGSKKPIDGRKKVHTLIIPVKAPSISLDYITTRIWRESRVAEEREFDANTLLRNHYNSVSCFTHGVNATDAVFGDGNLNLLDTSNTIRQHDRPIGQIFTGSLEAGGFGFVANALDDTFGIQVGTDDTAVDEDDYTLIAKIANGGAGGEFYYRGYRMPAPDSWDAGSQTFSIEHTRYFDNFSGGSITVNEVGLVSYIGVGGWRYNVLMARDIVPDGGQAVAYRDLLSVTYALSMYFPLSGSPLRNYWNVMFSCQAGLDGSDSGSFGDGNLNAKDTGGTLRSGSRGMGFQYVDNSDSLGKNYRGGANQTLMGILVGSGSTAVDHDDYTLDTLIAHGAGGGELAYGAHAVPTRTWADPVMRLRQDRTMTNNSGGDVSVNECGLVGRMLVNNTIYYIMTLRDVFSTVTVADTEDLRVIYDFEVTYP